VKLKTLKDIGLMLPKEAPLDKSYDDGYSTGGIVVAEQLRKDLRQEAIKWIKANQTGNPVDRDIVKESMRGTIAEKYWNDSIFTLGVEYGAIAMLMKFFNITEEDLK